MPASTVKSVHGFSRRYTKERLKAFTDLRVMIVSFHESGELASGFNEIEQVLSRATHLLTQRVRSIYSRLDKGVANQNEVEDEGMSLEAEGSTIFITIASFFAALAGQACKYYNEQLHEMPNDLLRCLVPVSSCLRSIFSRICAQGVLVPSSSSDAYILQSAMPEFFRVCSILTRAFFLSIKKARDICLTLFEALYIEPLEGFHGSLDSCDLSAVSDTLSEVFLLLGQVHGYNRSEILRAALTLRQITFMSSFFGFSWDELLVKCRPSVSCDIRPFISHLTNFCISVHERGPIQLLLSQGCDLMSIVTLPSCSFLNGPEAWSCNSYTSVFFQLCLEYLALTTIVSRGLSPTLPSDYAAFASSTTMSLQAVMSLLLEHSHVYVYINSNGSIDKHIIQSDVTSTAGSRNDFAEESQNGMTTMDTYHISGWGFISAAMKIMFRCAEFFMRASIELSDTLEAESIDEVLAHCARGIEGPLTLILRSYHTAISAEMGESMHTFILSAMDAVASHLAAKERYQINNVQARCLEHLHDLLFRRVIASMLGSDAIPVSRRAGTLPFILSGMVHGFLSCNVYVCACASPPNSLGSLCERNLINSSNKIAGCRNDVRHLGYLLSSGIVTTLMGFLSIEFASADSGSGVLPSAYRKVVHSLCCLRELLREKLVTADARDVLFTPSQLLTIISRSLRLLLLEKGAYTFAVNNAVFLTLSAAYQRQGVYARRMDTPFTVAGLLKSLDMRNVLADIITTQEDKGAPVEALILILELFSLCSSRNYIKYNKECGDGEVSGNPEASAAMAQLVQWIPSLLKHPSLYVRIPLSRSLPAILGRSATAVRNLLQCIRDFYADDTIDANMVHTVLLSLRVFLRPSEQFAPGRCHKLLDSIPPHKGYVAECKALIHTFLSRITALDVSQASGLVHITIAALLSDIE